MAGRCVRVGRTPRIAPPNCSARSLPCIHGPYTPSCWRAARAYRGRVWKPGSEWMTVSIREIRLCGVVTLSLEATCVSRHTTNALLPELREATTQVAVESDAKALEGVPPCSGLVDFPVDVLSARACGALGLVSSRCRFLSVCLSLFLAGAIKGD